MKADCRASKWKLGWNSFHFWDSQAERRTRHIENGREVKASIKHKCLSLQNIFSLAKPQAEMRNADCFSCLPHSTWNVCRLELICCAPLEMDSQFFVYYAKDFFSCCLSACISLATSHVNTDLSLFIYQTFSAEEWDKILQWAHKILMRYTRRWPTLICTHAQEQE